MRKFLILLSVVMLFVGVRLHYNWISSIDVEGVLTVFHGGGEVTTYHDGIPALLKHGDPVRLDISGDEVEARRILAALEAKELWSEQFDKLIVIYAYSSRISGFVSVLDHKVNLMVAINQNGIAIGSPILKGSY